MSNKKNEEHEMHTTKRNEENKKRENQCKTNELAEAE